MKALLGGVIAAAAMTMLSTTAMAEPEIVSGPAGNPECFVPWTQDTNFFKFPKKEGPYRIALANGYIANTWRIQMIQTAKAYAAQPEVAANHRHQDHPRPDRRGRRHREAADADAVGREYL